MIFSAKSFFFKLLFVLLTIAFAQTSLFSQEYLLKAEDKSFKGVVSAFDKYWEGRENQKGTGYKAFKRAEYFLSNRLDQNNALPNYRDIYSTLMTYRKKLEKEDRVMASNNWSFLGPFKRPSEAGNQYRVGTGRVSCIEIDPQNSNIIWAGAATGGVWKSTDKGASWVTFPTTEVMSIGIADIAVAPSNTSIVYAATGDADIAGMFGIVYNFSVGILKTTNSGSTWTLLAPFTPMQPANQYYINKLLVHPNNANLVYAATNAGLFTSTNGGTSWTNIYNSSTRDIKFQEANPNIIIGAGSSGANFVMFKYDATAKKVETTYTLSSCSRVALATTPINKTLIYGVASNWNQGFHSLIKSTDAGSTWSVVANSSNTRNILHRDYSPGNNSRDGQGMYDLGIAVSPTNENEIFVGGINVWKSTDGGKAWSITGYWLEGQPAKFIHADHHDFIFNKEGELFIGHDGGISYSKDKGANWIDISDNLHITQFYRLSNAVNPATLIYAGTQDNGTMAMSGTTWSTAFGGDGMETWINPNNTNIRYVSGPNGSIYKSANGGGSYGYSAGYGTATGQGPWLTSYVLDPVNPTIMYAGYQELFKSTNGGDSWVKTSNFTLSSTISAIAVAPSNNNIVYTAIAGQLHRSTDGGKTWTKLLQAENNISYIAVDPTNANTAWATVSGFSSNSKVLKVEGTKVTNLSAGLPNIPVNCVVYQKNSPGRIYIGTDAGVYTRDNNNQVWKLFGSGLPEVVVMELDIHYGTGKMRAATYGRGLWHVDVMDCNLEAPELLVIGETSFCAGDSVILEAKGNYSKFEWSNGSTNRRITVKTPGTYVCTVSDEKGCNATTEPIAVTVKTVKALEIKVITTGTLCEGDSIELRATSLFQNYRWSTGDTTKSIRVTKSGTYTCTAKYVTGCIVDSEPFILKLAPQPPKPQVAVVGNELSCNQEAKGHQWYKDGKPLSGATSTKLSASESGEYFLEVVGDNGCTNRSDIIKITVTAIEDISLDNYFSVSPNPVINSADLSAVIKKSGNITIDICDLLGVSIMKIEERVQAGLYTRNMDLSSLSSGIYIIKLITEEGSRIQKISVER